MTTRGTGESRMASTASSQFCIRFPIYSLVWYKDKEGRGGEEERRGEGGEERR